MNEVWKDVPGFEQVYKISNLGNIENKVTGKRRKTQTDKNGYVVVKLSENKRVKMVKVHRILAQAFIPNPLNLPQVLHNDDNVSNNDLSNLRGGSIKDNMFDKKLRNRYCSGEQHPMSKLTNNQRDVIAKRLIEGESGYKLSSEYRVNTSIVYRIKNRIKQTMKP